jgi:hypothetical protein
MSEINQDNLDTAITLGDAVCHELGICCETRGRVIFQIYKKLEKVKPKKDAIVTQQPDEVRVEQNASM